MTRSEKINLLQQVATGTASIEDMEPQINFGVFYMDGPTVEISVGECRPNPRPTLHLNPSQYTQWQKGIEVSNSRRRLPHTIHQITLIQDAGCKKLYHCNGLPNCLHGCGCKRNEGAM